jgi:predicted permease
LRTLAHLTSLLRNLFRRKQSDQDLDEEVRSYVALLTEEKIAAGMSREQAGRQAKFELGGIERIKEQVREIRAGARLDALIQDLRYAIRMLRKGPAFTVTAVLTLALGIGANTAIFTLLNGIMLRALPVRDPQQLVLLQWHARKAPAFDEYSSFNDCATSGPGDENPWGCSFSSPMFNTIHQQTSVFDGTLAFAGPLPLTVSGNGSASMASGEIVSGDYFNVLGVRAVLGRTIGPADDAVTAASVVVLRYGYWQEAFGGSPSAIGRTIRLNGVPFAIVGVADPGFISLTPGKTQDMWLTRSIFPRVGFREGWSRVEDAGNAWLAVVARLKPGISAAQAQAAVGLLFRNELGHGSTPLVDPTSDPSIILLPAQSGLTGERRGYEKSLRALMIAVCIILLATCANVAGLLLARSTTRRREIAVRLALGAPRMRVARQLLTESILLSVLGGLVGVLVAFWGVHAITVFVSSDSLQRFNFALTPDASVLTFTAAVSIVCGILFGLTPALAGTRIGLAPTLKENAAGDDNPSARTPGFSLSSALVVVQIALAVVILTGAGLLIRTLQNLKNINPGFDSRNILLFSLDPALTGYETAQIQNLYRELQSQFAALPGVISASYSSSALLAGDLSNGKITIEGQPDPQEPYDVDQLSIAPSFFDTMRIPIIAGRVFNASEAVGNSESATSPQLDAGKPWPPPIPAPLLVVINDAFVRRYFSKRSPLGMHLNRGDTTQSKTGTTDGKPRSRYWEIVGVVADAKYNELRREIRPTVYLPINGGGANFEVRTTVDPTLVIPAIGAILARTDANLPLSRIRTESQEISHDLFQERLIARLSSFFGLLALLLACVGVYGLLSYDVARRTREFGIRTALGADANAVLSLVIRRGVVLSVTGTIIGGASAVAGTRYLESLLYGVHAGDASTLAAVAALLTIVVLAACYIPARRATRVDPMIALRHE